MTSQQPSEPTLAGAGYSFLGVSGAMVLILGVLGLVATNRETPILGAGMVPAGVLMLVAKAGGRRGWRGFPWLPLGAAGLIAVATAMAFMRHMNVRSARGAAPPAAAEAPAAPADGRPASP